MWTQALVLPQTSCPAWHTDRPGCHGLVSLAAGMVPRKVKRWLWALGWDVGSCPLALLLAPLAGGKPGGRVRLTGNTAYLSQLLF